MSLRRTSVAPRAIVGALLGLLLALRLLSPAGFMPVFTHGAVEIVACPDYAGGSAPMAHHHGERSKFHQHCPYAAGPAPATLAEFTLLAAFVATTAALLLGRSSQFLVWHRKHRHPPARGPPLPA